MGRVASTPERMEGCNNETERKRFENPENKLPVNHTDAEIMRRKIGRWFDEESRNTKPKTNIGKGSVDIVYVEKVQLWCTES